jgi:hypothetical protein
MPLVHVCWIRKDGPKGVRVSAASEARRKNESLPLRQLIRTNKSNTVELSRRTCRWCMSAGFERTDRRESASLQRGEARRKNESLPLHQIKAPCQTRGGGSLAVT